MFQGFEAAAVDRLSEQALSTAGEEPETDAERAQFRIRSTCAPGAGSPSGVR
jgi:hypothetical protein